MGLFGWFSSAVGTAIDKGEARATIVEGLEEALGVMEGMLGNEGQQSVYDDYVVDAFQENAQAKPSEGWEDVDIGEYMDFMGEIVDEGNGIMADAYAEAQEIEEEFMAEGGEDFDFD